MAAEHVVAFLGGPCWEGLAEVAKPFACPDRTQLKLGNQARTTDTELLKQHSTDKDFPFLTQSMGHETQPVLCLDLETIRFSVCYGKP